MRVALPVTGLVLAASLFVSFRSIPTPIGNVDLGSIGVNGDTVTMEAPKLSGFGEQGSSYVVSADTAEQSLTSPNVVHLNGIDGRLDEADGEWTTLTALKGVMNTKDEKLRLDRDILLTTKDGKRAWLKSADVDFDKKTVTSDDPVKMNMDVGSVAADTMAISEGGKRIQLRGRVVVDLNREAAAGRETTETQ